MRFDDTLETVLAADLSTAYGVQSAWRQLVDLIGRRRVPPESRAMATLRALRAEVPLAVRAASARALEFGNPPGPLVRLLACDELQVALPVLRSARLSSAEWIQFLPELTPAARSVLRNRRDLSPVVRRALDSFGPIDFVLPDASAPYGAGAAEGDAGAGTEMSAGPEPERMPEPQAMAGEIAALSAESEVASPLEPEPVVAQAVGARAEGGAVSPAEPMDAEPDRRNGGVEAPVAAAGPEPDAPAASPVAMPAILSPQEDFSFVALAGAAVTLPLTGPGAFFSEGAADGGAIDLTVAQAPPEPQGAAMNQAPLRAADTLAASPTRIGGEASPPGEEEEGPFEIAEVVARIDAFRRDRDARTVAPAHSPAVATAFRFETDAKGIIRWVEGVCRAPLIGLGLDSQGMPDGSRIDAAAGGAFRHREGFSNARMRIEGQSDAAGDWLISAVPVFDSANGRFTGYRGTGRRPRTDERAEPGRASQPTSADSLRQLVHELRTPTNAIAGFAEMIETQMLGSVPAAYRQRAQVIREQARELLNAIDDLDLAARIDSAALALVPGPVPLRPVLAAIADDLAPLAELRGSLIALPVDDFAVEGDRRAIERLLSRLMATLVSAGGAGERIGIRTALEADDVVAIAIDRPHALAEYPEDSVLGIDDEREDATLLGTGFALRLARNLARELGGSLVIEPESLTLRLPAAVTSQVGQAYLS